MKKVKLKSWLELKQLIRDGKVEMLHASDDGERMTLGIVEGGMTHLFSVNTDEFSQDFEVTTLDNHISESQLARLKVLFE
jgi:hypothetical protein